MKTYSAREDNENRKSIWKHILPVVAIATMLSCNGIDKSPHIDAIGSLSKNTASTGDQLFVYTEHDFAMRERAIAVVVLERSEDLSIRELAQTVRDGHQLGIEKLRAIAKDMQITLPENLSPDEQAKVQVIKNIPVGEINAYFLIRQRAMHA